MTSADRLSRAYEAYRRTAWTRSAILLLLVNAIPIVGVLFFDWSLLTIVVLYWLENGIVGVWNVPKIILAQGPTLPAGQGPTLPARPVPFGPRATTRLSAIPRTGLAMFFAFHYGMFWLVHGIFVFLLPVFAGGAEGPCLELAIGLPPDCGPGAFGELLWPAILLGGIALFLSHGASFFLNYLGRAEYLTASPTTRMGAVYGRVVVLHLTIIFGSVLVAFLGAPIVALLVLVVLKTALDLGFHLRERRHSGPPLPTGVPSLGRPS